MSKFSRLERPSTIKYRARQYYESKIIHKSKVTRLSTAQCSLKIIILVKIKKYNIVSLVTLGGKNHSQSPFEFKYTSNKKARTYWNLLNEFLPTYIATVDV